MINEGKLMWGVSHNVCLRKKEGKNTAGLKRNKKKWISQIILKHLVNISLNIKIMNDELMC